jgi:DNA ligase D-like protein (predicted polymerase)
VSRRHSGRALLSKEQPWSASCPDPQRIGRRFANLAIDDVDGLIALAQMSAVELHPSGASEADPFNPDWLVFYLDPSEGVAFSEVVRAAHDMGDQLEAAGRRSFCRTTGGKGLHVVVPLRPQTDWGSAKAFCHAFAQHMSDEEPHRFLTHLKIADHRGRILIDWFQNRMGTTASLRFVRAHVQVPPLPHPWRGAHREAKRVSKRVYSSFPGELLPIC